MEHGFLDCGITGKDWIEENNSDVELIGKLEYSKVHLEPDAVGSGRTAKFADPIGKRRAGKANRDRGGRLDDPFSGISEALKPKWNSVGAQPR